MANCYESLGQREDAVRCYRRAESLGDSEGIALSKLATLTCALGEEVQWEACYQCIAWHLMLHGVRRCSCTDSAILQDVSASFSRKIIAEREADGESNQELTQVVLGQGHQR